MLRFVLLAVLLLIIANSFWKVVDGILEAAGITTRPNRSGRGGGPKGPTVRLVRDPVCGTHVAPNSAVTLTRGGTTYYFCSDRCREDFRNR